MKSNLRSGWLPALLWGILVLILAVLALVPVLPCSLCRGEELVVLVHQTNGVTVTTCPCCKGSRRMTPLLGVRSKLAKDDPSRW